MPGSGKARSQRRPDLMSEPGSVSGQDAQDRKNYLGIENDSVMNK